MLKTYFIVAIICRLDHNHIELSWSLMARIEHFLVVRFSWWSYFLTHRSFIIYNWDKIYCSHELHSPVIFHSEISNVHCTMWLFRLCVIKTDFSALKWLLKYLGANVINYCNLKENRLINCHIMYKNVALYLCFILIQHLFNIQSL